MVQGGSQRSNHSLSNTNHDDDDDCYWLFSSHGKKRGKRNDKKSIETEFRSPQRNRSGGMNFIDLQSKGNFADDKDYSKANFDRNVFQKKVSTPETSNRNKNLNLFEKDLYLQQSEEHSIP